MVSHSSKRQARVRPYSSDPVMPTLAMTSTTGSLLLSNSHPAAISRTQMPTPRDSCQTPGSTNLHQGISTQQPLAIEQGHTQTEVVPVISKAVGDLMGSHPQAEGVQSLLGTPNKACQMMGRDQNLAWVEEELVSMGAAKGQTLAGVRRHPRLRAQALLLCLG